MADFFWGFLSGGVLSWFAKEVLSSELRHRLARSGLHGAIEGRSGLFRRDEKNVPCPIQVGFFPGINSLSDFKEIAPFNVMYEYELFNDSDTQTIYQSMQLEIHGIEGLRLTCGNAPILTAQHGSIDWRDATSIVVPPHGIVRVRCLYPLPLDIKEAENHLKEFFVEAVAQTRLTRIDQKVHVYRIAKRSFIGADTVIWREYSKYPIYNQLSLNEDGRRSGGKPQKRKQEQIIHSQQPEIQNH